jgi:hypothetical protein
MPHGGVGRKPNDSQDHEQQSDLAAPLSDPAGYNHECDDASQPERDGRNVLEHGRTIADDT